MTTLTIDGSGEVLSETREGVTMPIDYSFKCVNDYVHCNDRQYEELECLALGMANHIDKLNESVGQKNSLLASVLKENEINGFLSKGTLDRIKDVMKPSTEND